MPVPGVLARGSLISTEYVPVYMAVAATRESERPIEISILAGQLRLSVQFVAEALSVLQGAGFAFPGRSAQMPDHQVVFVTDWYWWLDSRDGGDIAWDFVRRTARSARRIILDDATRPAGMLAWQPVRGEGSPS